MELRTVVTTTTAPAIFTLTKNQRHACVSPDRRRSYFPRRLRFSSSRFHLRILEFGCNWRHVSLSPPNRVFLASGFLLACELCGIENSDRTGLEEGFILSTEFWLSTRNLSVVIKNRELWRKIPSLWALGVGLDEAEEVGNGAADWVLGLAFELPQVLALLLRPPHPWVHQRTKLVVGPVVKPLLLIAATAVLIIWLIIGIPGSVFAGLVYGFLAPIMATLDAVGKGKEKPFVHCFVDGTWSTITGSCTVVSDIKNLLFHSYFSIMDDLRLQKPPDGEPYDTRKLWHAVAALIHDGVAALIGVFFPIFQVFLPLLIEFEYIKYIALPRKAW